jgi:hypothetical protein
MNNLTFSDTNKFIVNMTKVAAACKSEYTEFGGGKDGAKPAIRILMETGDWVTLVYDSEKTRDDDHEKMDFLTLAR